MEFIGSPPLHLLARAGDEWLLLPRDALEHIVSQHGPNGPGGSRFSDSMLGERPTAQDLEGFAANVVGLIRAGLESGAFRRSGVCFEFLFPGLPVGVDGAFVGEPAEGYLLKEEDGKGVLVPAVDRPARPTNKLSAIVLPAQPERLPSAVVQDPRVERALALGKLKVIASAFPGASLLPDGSPFPPSSRMIDSPVGLAGAGIACSEATARKINAAMARLGGVPPLEAVQRLARQAEEAAAASPAPAPEPAAKAPFEPWAGPAGEAPAPAQEPPPAAPLVEPTRAPAVAPQGRFVGCVAGPEGASVVELSTSNASQAIDWAQRHCSRDATVRLGSPEGAIALFSRWAGPQGPSSFGAPDATPAGVVLVAGVDAELDQAWVQSLARAVCDKLAIGTPRKPRTP